MTYSYNGSIEFRTSFDTSVYKSLSVTVKQALSYDEYNDIDFSYVESEIKSNARSSAELEREIIDGIEKEYFADVTVHEDFAEFIVATAKQNGLNVGAHVRSYSANSHNHEVYYVIDVELECEEDIEDDIQNLLTDTFNDFLRQLNYDCNTTLEPTIEGTIDDVTYDTEDGDEDYTSVDFKADLVIEFDPEDALNSVTCCACTFTTDEV